MKTTYIMVNIIRNSIKGAAALLGVALVMAGCQRDGLAGGEDSGDGLIRYSVSVAGGVKGALINTSGDDNRPLPADSSFFVSAYKGSDALFENQKATSNGSGFWTNDNPQYWPLSTKLAFFAYANTPSSTVKMNAERTADTLTYTVPADASEHQDILLGYYYGNGGSKGIAEIRFGHPLTAVLFKEGSVAGNISSITLSGLASGGSVTMTAAGIGDWTVATGEQYKKSVTLSGGDAPLAVDATSKLIGKANGAFLLVPQKLAASEGGHPVTVTVALTTTGGDVTVTADINSGEWKAGKTNTYTLSYGSDKLSLAPDVTPWDVDPDTVLTMKDATELGLLSGEFSVSATKKVRFAKGNLKATRTSSASSDWKLSFFEHQYDYYSEKTSFSINDTEMSLFTWKFKDAATSFNPVGNTTDGIEDWGEEYNRQHGLPSGTWRTLTGGSEGEWYYLLELRGGSTEVSHTLRGLRTVHDIANCLVIVPDDFDATKWPKDDKDNYKDIITDTEWEEMEAMGAVCLVPAGYRAGETGNSIGTYGPYWSSTPSSDSDEGYGLYFGKYEH